MVTVHISVETKAERQRPDAMIDDLQRDHQDAQPPARADEVLRPGHQSVRMNTRADEYRERRGTESPRDIRIARRRSETRHKAEQVRYQDENEKRAEDASDVDVAGLIASRLVIQWRML